MCETKRQQAKLLPKGWTWQMYEDGSGCLVDPKGQEFFIYDCVTQEYQISQHKRNQYMENYPGATPFDEFQKFAERWILQNVLGQKEPIVYLRVGRYVPAMGNQDEIIEREYYRQGSIYKNEEAFLNHEDAVCYIPELSDATYTRRDFLDLCNGQEEFAKECFYACDWQHPETWFDEQFQESEWGWCEDCHQIYDMEGTPCPCPKCGFKSNNTN